MSNNLSKLLFKVLKAYDVSINYRTVDNEIKSNSEYPSMKCVSDALDSWKVNLK